MKLKIVLFVSAASVALAGLLGAGTAAATVFCEENKSPCPEAQRWKEGTAIDFTASQIFTFTLPEGTTYEGCQSTLLTAIRKTGGATSTVVSETTKLTWFGCTQANQDTLVPGELEFHAIEGTSNATVTVKNLKLQLTGKLVNCVMTSGASAHFGTLTSSGTGDAILDVSLKLVPDPLGSCWTPEVRLTGAYTQASPVGTPLFVKTS